MYDVKYSVLSVTAYLGSSDYISQNRYSQLPYMISNLFSDYDCGESCERPVFTSFFDANDGGCPAEIFGKQHPTIS